MHSALQMNFIIFPQNHLEKEHYSLHSHLSQTSGPLSTPHPHHSQSVTSSPSPLPCLMSSSHHILLPSCNFLGPSSSSRADIPHSAHPKACPITLLRTLCGLPYLLRLNSLTWLTSPLTTVADTWCSVSARHCSALLTPVVLPTTS